MGGRDPVPYRNKVSALGHKGELLAKLNKEIDLVRIIGPFDVASFPNVHSSRIDVLPKK